MNSCSTTLLQIRSNLKLQLPMLTILTQKQVNILWGTRLGWMKLQSCSPTSKCGFQAHSLSKCVLVAKSPLGVVPQLFKQLGLGQNRPRQFCWIRHFSAGKTLDPRVVSLQCVVLVFIHIFFYRTSIKACEVSTRNSFKDEWNSGFVESFQINIGRPITIYRFKLFFFLYSLLEPDLLSYYNISK